MKPFHINVPQGGIPGFSHTNEVSGPYSINVSDIRGREAQFSLDKHGFQILREANEDTNRVLNALPPKLYPDLDLVMAEVGPAMETLIRNQLNAETVISFAFRVELHTCCGYPTPTNS